METFVRAPYRHMSTPLLDVASWEKEDVKGGKEPKKNPLPSRGKCQRLLQRASKHSNKRENQKERKWQNPPRKRHTEGWNLRADSGRIIRAKKKVQNPKPEKSPDRKTAHSSAKRKIILR